MGIFYEFTSRHLFEITYLSALTGKSEKTEIEATSVMDIEHQKSAFVRQGHTVYGSRKITGDKKL